jgi:hypothetical protein
MVLDPQDDACSNVRGSKGGRRDPRLVAFYLRRWGQDAAAVVVEREARQSPAFSTAAPRGHLPGLLRGRWRSRWLALPGLRRTR